MAKRREDEMRNLLDRFSEYICDQLCKWPEKISDPEKLEKQCKDCKHGEFRIAISYVHNRYRRGR